MVIFPLVGALTAILYFSLFSLLWYGFKIHYGIAVSIAYLTSATFQFFANQRYTFQNREKRWHKIFYQMVRYVIMVLINYVITLAVVYFVVEVLRFSPPVGVVVTVGITVFSSYLLSRYWVFSSKE